MTKVTRVECVDCCKLIEAGEIRCTYHKYRPAPPLDPVQIMTPSRALAVAAKKIAELGQGPASVQQELHKHGILVSIEECREALKEVTNA